MAVEGVTGYSTNKTRNIAHATRGQERKLDWSTKIAKQFPDRMIFMSFMNSLGVEEIDEVEFNIWVQGREAQWVNVIADGGGTLTTEAGHAFRVVAGSMLYSHVSEEVMRVTQDPTANNTIYVTRGWGSTGTPGNGVAETTLVDNDSTPLDGTAAGGVKLRVIAPSFEENFTTGSAISSRPTTVTNYMQNLSEVIKFSDDMALLKMDWGKEEPRLIENAMFRFGVQMELACLFGTAHMDETTGINNQPIRTMGGLKEYISTHVNNFNGAVTELLMDQYLEEQFRYVKGNELVGIAGGKAAMYINQVMKSASHINVSPKDDTYGFKGTRYCTPFGDLVIGVHKEMSYDAGVQTIANNAGYNYSFANDMFLIDPGNIKLVHARGYKPTLRTDIGLDTTHGTTHEFYTKMSLKMEHESSHGWWKNILSAG